MWTPHSAVCLGVWRYLLLYSLVLNGVAFAANVQTVLSHFVCKNTNIFCPFCFCLPLHLLPAFPCFSLPSFPVPGCSAAAISFTNPAFDLWFGPVPGRGGLCRLCACAHVCGHLSVYVGHSEASRHCRGGGSRPVHFCGGMAESAHFQGTRSRWQRRFICMFYWVKYVVYGFKEIHFQLHY